jgi:predicted CXXCH cytochrome family protein
MPKAFTTIFTVSALLLAALGYAITGPYADFFRPGPMFGGHQRFGGVCTACHELWRGPSAEKCVYCHANVVIFNTHSESKFAAPLRAEVDARYKKLTCVGCHREHKGDETGGARYTGKPGMCLDCHKKDGLRSDHQEYAASACAQTACHSYHFNISRGMFDDNAKVRLLEKSMTTRKMEPSGRPPATPAELSVMRESLFYKGNPAIAAKYDIGPHNGSAATCARCHTTPGGRLVERPSFKDCSGCHTAESYGYSAGRHGAAPFRDAAQFPLPRENVGCGSCHDVHSLILSSARREACKKCHAGKHVLNYEKSGHYRYLSDPVFALKPVTGVDCAGCHMPKMDDLAGHTMHNESYTISGKLVMAQVVCARCHGMKFNLTNLFDPSVIESNFTYTSSVPAPEGLAGYFRAARVE